MAEAAAGKARGICGSTAAVKAARLPGIGRSMGSEPHGTARVAHRSPEQGKHGFSWYCLGLVLLVLQEQGGRCGGGAATLAAAELNQQGGDV